MPPKILRLSRDRYLETRWKNGQGTTAQIAIHPESAELSRGDYDWRLSSATIERSGEFSTFPGYDRILVALSPGGFRIFHSPDPHAIFLGPLEKSYPFSGDLATRVELADPAPAVDLGLLLRREVVAGAMAIRQPGDSVLASGDWNLIFTVGGMTSLGLEAGDSAVLPRGEKFTITEGPAVFITIRKREGGV